MKLTKEECLKSLSALSLGNYCFDNITSKYPYLKYEYDCLFELIDKYFDNPPLKFEELKELAFAEKQTWVWDNKNKMYCNVGSFLNRDVVIHTTHEWIYENSYEENRFYRKQVEDEQG